MNLPKNRKDDYSKDAISKRIGFINDRCGTELSHISESHIEPDLTKGNIENIIGFTQVPIGAIGPLKINGDFADGEYYVPLSTTEGALVASFNRGARVITLSGGANVAVVRDSIQRAPFFEMENLFHARKFVDWIEKHFIWLQQIAQSTTNNGKLLSYHAFIQGKVVYLRLNYSTGDAMGMNMITKATLEVCNYIVNHFPVVRYSLESNMAVDKKPAHINSILGRGKTVSSEVVVKKELLTKYLKTTARELEKVYHKQVIGGIMAGTLGANGHYANGIAALFLACGQDLANISESCVGYTSVEAIGEDLYVSVNLPSLVVGTVGGGVSLPTQRECLEMIGCYGTGKSKKFAEIVAATALAGEISLAASIVAGDFVAAHEKYGRNKPKQDVPQIRN
ncbi:MAG TPA: hydroxymethylglutaryl-CoA reductase [Mariniphaga sp.]|nr:hydroxymethylglutaryl-CoA reductase [Mariniphaga sp.]